jgi:hypothetical protein
MAKSPHRVRIYQLRLRRIELIITALFAEIACTYGNKRAGPP